MKRLLTAIVAFGVAIAVAEPAAAQDRTCKKPSKIVGGDPADKINWPFQAALRVHSETINISNYFCGGTVIAPRWVLTAAHCLTSYVERLSAPVNPIGGVNQTGRLQVVLGVDKLSGVEPKNVFEVERIVFAPKYKTEVDKALKKPTPREREKDLSYIPMETGHDIALIKLKRTWPGVIAELSLSASSELAAQENVSVSGFGQINPATNSTAPLPRFKRADNKGDFYAGSDKLMFSGIARIPQPQCATQSPLAMIGAGQVCAGDTKATRDSCNGDSGGPLVVLDKNNCMRQIGLVSWGIGCAQPKSYGVYTRISAHAAWIKATLGTDASDLDAAPVTPKSDVVTEALAAAEFTRIRTLLGPDEQQLKADIKVGTASKTALKVGDTSTFEMTSRVEGRLILLDLDARQKVALIYPNAFYSRDDIGRIARDTASRIPEVGAKQTHFKVSPPLGKSRLIALVAPSDFYFDRYPAERDGVTDQVSAGMSPASLIGRLRRQVETYLRAEKELTGQNDLSKWAFTVKEYMIE